MCESPRVGVIVDKSSEGSSKKIYIRLIFEEKFFIFIIEVYKKQRESKRKRKI